MPDEDGLNLVAAALALLVALAALIPGLAYLAAGRAGRIVDVVVQARWRIPERPGRRAGRAVAIGVVLLVAAGLTLLVPSNWAGLVFSGAMFGCLFLRARPLEAARGGRPEMPARPTSSDPVQLHTPFYRDQPGPERRSPES